MGAFPAMLALVGAELQVADPFDRYFPYGAFASERLRGVRVRIPKGILIRSMHPRDPEGWFATRRSSVITVFGAGQGHFFEPYKQPRDVNYVQAELTWAGTGGYWRRVKLRDVEILDDLGIPAPTSEEVEAFDHALAQASPAPPLL